MSKATQNRSKFKIQRRLGVELPGLGKAGALAKRPYAPGHHGQRRRRMSEYALRFSEKQKVIFHYGLREKQMHRFIHEAKKIKHGEWVDHLINILEKRLDNILFRLGFAPSIPAARQMVRHRHVLVNGKRVDIPSYIVKKDDKISLTDKGYKNQNYLGAKANPRLELPAFLSKEGKDKETGTIIDEPTAKDVPFEFEKRFLTEYYFKVK